MTHNDEEQLDPDSQPIFKFEEYLMEKAQIQKSIRKMN